jgi:hypothetical protein
MLQRDFDASSLIDMCSLAIDLAFPGEVDRQKFHERLDQFVAADKFTQHVIRLDGDTLRFESESLLPPKLVPEKPSLFFIVGNPAPESIARRAMYAFEGNGARQHRFWKVLHTTGVLRFSENDPDTHSPETKMNRLFGGQYWSPFNIHIVPFFSLPSPPGGPWSGVAGLRRLFGKKFPAIMHTELELLKGLLETRLRHGDSVLISQKDAYTAIKPDSAPDYSSKAVRTAALESWHGGADVTLACIPPTRLFYSTAIRSILTSLVQQATVNTERVGGCPTSQLDRN